MAHGGADAIGAGVAAADDDDIFAFGGDEIAVLVLVEQALVFAVRKSIAK